MMDASKISKLTGYYEHGTLKRGRQSVATYYKCAKVAPELREWVNDNAHAALLEIRAQYAPELRKAVLILLTDAERKRGGNAAQVVANLRGVAL